MLKKGRPDVTFIQHSPYEQSMDEDLFAKHKQMCFKNAMNLMEEYGVTSKGGSAEEVQHRFIEEYKSSNVSKCWTLVSINDLICILMEATLKRPARKRKISDMLRHIALCKRHGGPFKGIPVKMYTNVDSDMMTAIESVAHKGNPTKWVNSWCDRVKKTSKLSVAQYYSVANSKNPSQNYVKHIIDVFPELYWLIGGWDCTEVLQDYNTAGIEGHPVLCGTDNVGYGKSIREVCMALPCKDLAGFICMVTGGLTNSGSVLTTSAMRVITLILRCYAISPAEAFTNMAMYKCSTAYFVDQSKK